MSNYEINLNSTNETENCHTCDWIYEKRAIKVKIV